jgi:protein phosphatase
MRIDVAAQTDIGRRKRNNEDFYGVFRDNLADLNLFHEGALLSVADGLGGHAGGEIASKLSVSFMRDMLKTSPPPPADDPEEDEEFLPVLREWIKKANDSVFSTNQDVAHNGKPMGTTLLTALVTPKKVYIANVGDSRIYHLRDGDIIDKSEDHSWVDEQVKLGLMTKSEAESDSRRNYVTRCIGTHAEVEVDSYVWHPAPGDMLLLCTDGLVNMVKDSDIAAQFKGRSGPAEIASNLIDMANENGGKDNITVIVATVSPSLYTMLRSRLLAFWRKRAIHFTWILFALLFGAACGALGYYLGSSGIPG